MKKLPSLTNNLQLHNLCLQRSALLALLCLSVFAPRLLRASDVTWTNGSASSAWNLSDPNWSIGPWNNANGDGAIFGSTGAGAINVTDPINVSSMNFTANGYTLGGAGSLNFVNGSSTLGFGFLKVADPVTATINTAINSSAGIIKLGGGALEFGGPLTFNGPGFSIDPRGKLPTDLIVGGGSDSNFAPILGGTIRLLNSSVLPATTRLGVSNGLFDFGANNITIGALNFVNQANNTAGFNSATGVGGAGVFGPGTLRVTGEINVVGATAGNFNSNSIGSNLDMGGGTQIVRTSANGTFMNSRSLQFTGALSNGSLLKTFGISDSGIMGQPDGVGLFANNTYTGSSTFNGGQSLIAGMNATSSVYIVGDRGAGAPAGSTLTLQGANGSLGSATIIQAVAGGIFIIDNNVALSAGGDAPTVASAQNNDRIRDDATIQLGDGNFTYRGKSATAASETFGNLDLVGGHNNVTLTPGSSGGTASLTVNGNLTLTPRATLEVSSSTLGGASKMFINGTMPAADATGILSRVAGSTDFLTYNATTGLTPYTGYATDFSTAGTNVATSAAASVANSIAVNAIKTTGSGTTTIAAGQTLGVDSGMMLNTSSSTRTYAGGTIAFGANPGVFFAGTTGSGPTTISSAITGSSGLINANSVLTLNGDLSGLTGTITDNLGFAQINLGTNTFAGAFEVRGGVLAPTTATALASPGGAITLGVAENDDHLVNNFANLNLSSAGANAVVARDIIVDNGSYDAAGLQTVFGFLSEIQALNNNTGSQTINGNIILNSPLRLQGGGATGANTNATILNGNISGPAQFYLANGRANLTGSYSNAGGFRVGEQGFTSQASFLGTAVGSAPIVFEGGNNSFIAYNAGSLPTGTITVEGSGGGFTASLNPLQNSTINNVINLSSTISSNLANGITGNWSGQLNGVGGLTKSGTGTLVLGNASNTYSGLTLINGGTLVASNDGAVGTGNVSLNAASVQLTLQNGTSNNYIDDTATLNVGFTSDSVNLPFTGSDSIKALVINTVPQATGTWGPPTSGAMHTDPIFTGNGMLNVLSQLTVTSAVSHKNHGGTDFDLPLPLAPSTPAIESRQGNSTNDYTIIVTLNDAVTVNGSPQAAIIAGVGSIGSSGTSNGGKVTVSGNTVTIPLTNITSQQTIQVRLNGVNGFSNFVIPMSVLVGDTTGDGTVNSADIGQTKSQSGNTVTASNFRADVMVDGSINSSDVSLVKSKSGTALP